MDRITETQIELEFLRGEWYSHKFDDVRTLYTRIIEHPDLQDQEQVEIRKNLLLFARAPLLQPIPIDTEWYECEITPDDFHHLRIIRDTAWTDTFGQSTKLSAAAKCVRTYSCTDRGVDFDKVNSIKKQISESPIPYKIICIAQDVGGATTVLEGNHRALACELLFRETGLNKYVPSRIILGISPSMDQVPWYNE